MLGSFRRLQISTVSLRSTYSVVVSISSRASKAAETTTHLWILVKIAATSYVGLQRFCKISKHSSPVPYTFGWNICEMNLTPGGLLGYCSSKCITRRNVPSSKGVSAGPMMTAFLVWISDVVEGRRRAKRDTKVAHQVMTLS